MISYFMFDLRGIIIGAGLERLQRKIFRRRAKTGNWESAWAAHQAFPTGNRSRPG